MEELLDIQIKNYEGPLDLLIHLIHRNELNIFDVPISEITQQFVDEVRRMQEIDMEVAADFIYMASYLIHLKSRSLLPRDTTHDEDISLEEEGFNLAQTLIELAFCKDLAMHLSKQAEVSSRYLLRRDSILLSDKEIGRTYYAEGSIHDLANMYFMSTIKAPEEKVIIRSTKNISDEVSKQTKRLILDKKQTLWSELVKVYSDNFEKAIAFSTILTMSKQQLIKSIQEKNFDEILMKRLKLHSEITNSFAMGVTNIDTFIDTLADNSANILDSNEELKNEN